MAATLTKDVLEDNLAVSLARAMAAANKHARQLGVDIVESLVTITQQPVGDDSLWRINYGPRDYRNRRGGDLIIEIDPNGTIVKRVVKGQ